MDLYTRRESHMWYNLSLTPKLSSYPAPHFVLVAWVRRTSQVLQVNGKWEAELWDYGGDIYGFRSLSLALISSLALIKCPSSRQKNKKTKDKNWMKEKRKEKKRRKKSQSHLFSQLGLVQVVVFLSPLVQAHTHKHTQRLIITALREDRTSQKVGSRKSSTSLQLYSPFYSTLTCLPPQRSPFFVLFSFPPHLCCTLPVWSVRVTWLWQLLTRSRPLVAPAQHFHHQSQTVKQPDYYHMFLPSPSPSRSQSCSFAWWRR